MSSKHHERPEGADPAASAETKVLAPESPEAAPAPSVAPAIDAKDSEIAALRDRVAALEAHEASLTEEVSSLKDQYLRKLADYENFRKRMFREREDSLKFANTGVLTDMIGILDDFDRAIVSAEHARDYQILHDGVVLIRRQLAQMLANKHGLSTFPAKDQPFDPNIHEAVASEMADVAEPMVCQEFLPGYKLHDRVIRSAKVKVQMPAPGAARPAGQEESSAARNPADSAGGENPSASGSAGAAGTAEGQ